MQEASIWQRAWEKANLLSNSDNKYAIEDAHQVLEYGKPGHFVNFKEGIIGK